tara:strand:+ start:204 stop:488 length:285 start_codon:yes stop_codon:yes gene_type:complete
MKKKISYLLRLTISYSKFIVMLFTLSLLKTEINQDQNFKYLSHSSCHLKISTLYIGEQQNIRRINLCPKNFFNVDKKFNLNELNINYEKNRRNV